MPVNRNALIRYKTIDSCLRNRRRKWTLEALIEAVSDVLYEYEGVDKGISRRTIQADLQIMRSDKLGYNAPIIVLDKKYYTYENPEYSITRIPLNELDLQRMNEAVEMLRQFKGFSHFNQLNNVIQKLEDHVYAASHHTSSVIDFEKNDQLKGLEFLEPLYQAIIQQKPVRLRYQSFRSKEAREFILHPWWLKEFKNRWFVIGIRKDHRFEMNLALDRLQLLEEVKSEVYIPATDKNIQEYYRDVIGVTVNNKRKPNLVKIWVNAVTAPYVETKPLHSSQVVLDRTLDGILIQLRVQLNHELEKEILGFGEGMKVLAPESLKGRIHGRLKEALLHYK
jgi:predicted DNA-binding transcriptional regulator YafY